MSASYRLIHFTPNPFTDARLPLGAVVVEQSGAVRVAKVAQPPLGALDDPTQQRTCQRLYDRLDAIRSATALPPVFGPYTTLGPPIGLPEAVADPFAWVDGLLNPRRPAPRRAAMPRATTRASQAWRFFETFAVDHLVQKTFRPTLDAPGRLPRAAQALPTVCHWVEGGAHLLLLEPLIPGRPSFAQELRTVTQRMGAWRCLLGDATPQAPIELIVWLTAGGPAEQHEAAAESLAPFVHAVIDTDAHLAREAFLAKIRRVASSQTLLPAA